MEKIKSLDDLQKFREQIIEEKRRKASAGKVELIVTLGSCGIAAGALDVLQAVKAQVKADRLDDALVLETGCIGLCHHEPILEVVVGNQPKVTYGHVTVDAVKRIMREHVLDGKVVEDYVINATQFPTM